MWVTILTKLKTGKCQWNSIDSHSSVYCRQSNVYKCIFLIQLFSSSDAHMKIYLLSLFEWGEILYKKQNCKNFIYLCTFIVALKFSFKINKCNWKRSWYFHKLNCFVIFPLQESVWDLSGNLIFYENVCFTIKETQRSKSFKWSEFTMIVIKYSI